MAVILDVRYKDEDPRHILDIYTPNAQSTDVVMFVHGGAWTSGSKSEHSALGLQLSAHGLVVIVVEYRISSKIDGQYTISHPAHVKDVCDSLVWIDSNLESLLGYEYENIYLIGHSAGAHMIGLAIIEDWLPRRIVDRIQGLIMVEGIYDIQRLANLYPNYVDWFLIRAFPDRATWPNLSLFRPGITSKLYIMHSKTDELVSESHCCEYLAYCKKSGLGLEFFELFGSHDGVLETQLFYDSIIEIIKVSQKELSRFGRNI